MSWTHDLAAFHSERESQLFIDRAYRFTKALCRTPGASIARGLRAIDQGDPDSDLFVEQHKRYVEKLAETGVSIKVLPALEEFPDSVFIEDAAMVVDGVAIVLRPGAPSRAGEASLLRPDLVQHCDRVIALPSGHLDGGDVLLTGSHAFVGLSDRTNKAGVDALAEILEAFAYRVSPVQVPPEVLHFKSDCGLLDESTIFATKRLARTGCFDGYRVIETPPGEELAANLIRVNEHVLLSDGFPQSEQLLREAGYQVETLDTSEAARVDGGLSCLSLRF